MSRPRLPLGVNKVESVGQQEAMIGIEDDDVKERQTEPYLKMTTEKKAESKCDSDGNNLMSREDMPRYQKRRKTRRGKAKRRKIKPYSKTFWEDRRQVERDRRQRPVNDALTEVFIHGQPVAPYNTTQFLIDDHNSFPDIDEHLQSAVGLGNSSDKPNPESPAGEAVCQNPSKIRPTRPRTRDSSFSVDSDDDYFYSSPEDEGEFLTKEFSNTYEDIRVENLGSLSKAQLIENYRQLEGKVDMLEKKLQKSSSSAERKVQTSKPNNSDEVGLDVQVDSSQGLEQGNNSVCLDESLNFAQQDVHKLIMENERLSRENERLRHMCSKVGLGVDVESVSSSVDSESDSSSSSYSSIGDESADSSDRTDTLQMESKTLPLDA